MSDPIIVGHYYQSNVQKKIFVTVKSINSTDITVRMSSPNRIEKGEPFPWSIQEWNDKEFIDLDKTEEDTKNKKQTDEETPPKSDFSARKDGKDMGYSFIFNTETKCIDVYDPSGAKIAELNTLHGEDGDDGKSAYEIWAEKQPADEKSIQHFDSYIKGEKGNDGKSAFELWVEGKKPEEPTFESFLEYIKGKKGDKGQSAYELWTSSQPADKRSHDDFFAFLSGKDGEDGKSAYQLWREEQPEKKGSLEEFFNSLKGKNGEDGESAFSLWLKLHPQQGQATEADFFKWIASQVGTQEGASYIPFIEDGKLHFKNSKTEEETIPVMIKGKDGKTFSPRIDGYELYFENEEGCKTHRVNLRGKDGRTFTPKWDGASLCFETHDGEKTEAKDLRGKNAFELWKEETGNGNKSFEEFMESFRGHDGINVIAKHSYLDVKDFTCPIQEINTTLIANILGSAKSPDDIIDEREREINDKREKGREKIEGNKEKKYRFFNGCSIYVNWGGFLKEFAWWCAGTDRPLLRMCPGDHSKYVGIGTVIFFTALMAWFSSFIAMQLVFGKDDVGTFISIIFATFWALMIFFLDRFITNTMYSDGKVSISKEELVGGLPRILIAIFLGIVISVPLELKIFEKEIENDIELNKHETIKEVSKSLNNEICLLEAKQDTISLYITSAKNNAIINASIDERIKEANSNNREILRKISQNKNRLRPYTPWGDRDSNPSGWNAYDEKLKAVDSRAIEDEEREKNRHYEEITKLESQKNSKTTIDTYKSQLEEIDGQIADKKKLIEQREKEALNEFDKNKNGLYMKISALHKIALNGYIPWFIPADTIWIDKNSNMYELKYNEEKYRWQSLADTICHTWWWYLLNSSIGLIMLLLILIDISPVLYKMMLADGVYDNYLHQEKLLAQDRIRLSLAKMLRSLDKGELKSLAPFVLGKIYRKMAKFSYDPKAKPGDKDYKQPIWWGEDGNIEKRMEEENRAVFEKVLDYKKRIILASYAAWYRDMRDAMIGSKDDKEGSKINPDSAFNDAPSKKDNTESSDDDEPHKEEQNNSQNKDTNEAQDKKPSDDEGNSSSHKNMNDKSNDDYNDEDIEHII